MRKIWDKMAERELDNKTNNRKNYDLAVQRRLYKIARERAIEKELAFDIRPEDIPLVHTCPIRGVEMVQSVGKLSNDSYTLDRVDSDKGYVKGNIRVISWLANNVKSNLTITEIENLLKYMKGEL